MYISNAKLTNLEEISVSSFLFFALLVGFSSPGPLSGGFAPPAAQANLRSVFHDFKACATLRILHFYLELRSWFYPVNFRPTDILAQGI